MLAERAAELGVEIRRGSELVGLSPVGRRGHAWRSTGRPGAPRCGPATWSAPTAGTARTRKLAGIGFPGITNDRTVAAPPTSACPTDSVDPATGGLTVPGYGVIPPFLHTRTERGLVSFAPFPDGRVMLNVAERADVDERRADDLRRAARQRSGGWSAPTRRSRSLAAPGTDAPD